MTDSERQCKIRPLAIVGRAAEAAHLALRRVLRAKERDQPLIVLDYQGAAAALLDDTNRGNLHKTPLLWCDLANRRKPTAIFRMQRSTALVPSLKSLLAQCSQLVTNPLSESTIEWATKLAWHLADQGTVGLAALLRALHRPEILQWFKRQHALTDEISRLTDVLGYLLRFPAVWAASEGNNPLDLEPVLNKNGTVWFEMPSQHLEEMEHRVVSHMAEAAVLGALLSETPDRSATAVGRNPPLILYAFPAAVPLSFRLDAGPAKHVGVFGLSPEHPLPKSAEAWLDADADCWVVGGIGRLPVGARDRWLNSDELVRVRTLQPGELWARSGSKGKAVTMRVRVPEPQSLLAHYHRRHSLKNRRMTPIKQFSSAVATVDPEAAEGIDLYAALCQKEELLRGWLRVKTHDRESHGSDQVTIAQFGAHLEREVDRLAEDLESGRYRCRPLRTVRIPKADGGERVLKIACIRDQVAQATCLGLIEPLFEPRFSHFSFAYRPNRSAHHALAFARSAIRAGKAWAVTADIRSCFDTIDHDVLLRLLRDVVGDPILLRLIRHWLSVDAFDFHGLIPSELGVPQGNALSPVLANVYLDPLDKEFERIGIKFARYADDYLLMCETKDEAEVALRVMADFLQAVLRLSLKPAKTQFRPTAEGVGFLGFVLDDRQVRIQQEKLDRAANAIRRDMETLASPRSTLSAKSAALQHMNALIRGFRGYFLIDDAPQIISQLRALDVDIEKAACSLLPISLRHEMAWLARERLAPADSAEHPDEAAASDSANIIGTYPNYQGAALSCAVAEATDARDSAQAVASGTVEPRREPQDAQAEDGPDAGDGVLIDGRLYVMSAGAFVTVQREDLVVRRRQQELRRAPLDALAMVVLQGPGIGISVDLTIKLSERDVPVVFAPPFGRPAAIAASLQGGRSRLRQQQILRRNDPEILNVGIAMLAAKAGNQASVLKYFARYRKKQAQLAVHDELAKTAADIRSLADLLKELDASSAGLRGTAMGYEGRAAALYWSSLARLIPEELSFPGRRTQHATDPFNQAINYVYGVLYGEVWKAIVHAGLDPYSGIMHGSERDQGSLIFDLIEEFRAPFGDRLVLGMLGRGFQPQLGRHGSLRTSVRRLLVGAFHRMWNRPIRWRGKMHSPCRILEQQAKALVGAFLAEETYRPFQFRW